MNRLASCLPLLVFGLAIACGDGSGDGDGGSGPIDGDPVPPDEAPEAAQQTFCGAWAECDCAKFNDYYASEAACEAEITAALEQELQEAEAAGLTYDPACMGDLLALYEAFGCRTFDDLIADADDFARYDTVCKVFHGDDAAGTSCTTPTDLSGDSCEQGLECDDGTCVVPVIIAKGAMCESGDECADGAVCVPVDSATEYTCAELPEAGQTCLGMLDLCSFDAYCDQTSKRCAGLPAIGEPCAMVAVPIGGRCAAGALCEEETCVAAPAAGEPCTEGCASGSTCDEGVCKVEAPLACGIAFGDEE